MQNPPCDGWPTWLTDNHSLSQDLDGTSDFSSACIESDFETMFVRGKMLMSSCIHVIFCNWKHSKMKNTASLCFFTVTFRSNIVNIRHCDMKILWHMWPLKELCLLNLHFYPYNGENIIILIILDLNLHLLCSGSPQGIRESESGKWKPLELTIW